MDFQRELSGTKQFLGSHAVIFQVRTQLVYLGE
jgi:hypothetical protein